HDRTARVAERFVHAMGERMKCWCLTVTRNDKAGAAVRLQIVGDALSPLQDGRRETGRRDLRGSRSCSCASVRRRRTGIESGGDELRERFDLTGFQRKAVVGT